MKVLLITTAISIALFGFGIAKSVEQVKNLPRTDAELQKQGRIFENIINNTLEGIKKNLTDPIKIEQLKLNFTQDMLSGYAQVADVQLYGLKQMIFSKLSLGLLSMKLDFTLSIPSIVLNLDYDADVLLAKLLPLYGLGKANVYLKELEIEGTAAVNLTGGISMKNVKVAINLGSASFDLHGLIYDEDFSAIVSQILTQNVAKFMNEQKELISGVISPIFQAIINSVLKPSSVAYHYIEANLPEDFDFEDLKQA